MSAAVAIPLAMGYGMFAFVSLGDGYFGNGVLAGLWTAMVVGIVCVVGGNPSPTVYAPRITTTFYLGLVLFGLNHSTLATLRAGGVPAVLAVFFGIIFLGGMFQALFGLIRLGTLIKFTPHPVMAGFQNAAALLLLLVQSSTLLGMDHSVPFARVKDHLAESHPLTLLVVAAAVLVTWNGKKIAPKIPPVLQGLAAGTVAWYALTALGLRALLGPVIGDIPQGLITPLNLEPLRDVAGASDVLELSSLMFFAALALAFIASMDALLCERIVAGPTAPPRNSDVQLVRLGVGNMLAALCGGITSGLNIGPSALNKAQGGRTPLSVVVNVLVIFGTVLLLMPVLGHLPRAALSGVIVVVAIQHFDPWTIGLVKRMLTQPQARRRDLVIELVIVLVVALLSVLVNIVTAVFIGILIAAAMFMLRMSRSVIHRCYHCDTVRSNKNRDSHSMALLAEHGGRVAVFELEGPIFFGSAERLAVQVRAAIAADTRAVVLDFRRINDIDSTGAGVLMQLQQGLAADGRSVRFSGMQHRLHVGTLMTDLGVLTAIPASMQFPDVDRAIESAEDELLATLPDARNQLQDVPFESLDLLSDLQPQERETVRQFLSERKFERGEVVFREGDEGSELFVITQGHACVELRLGDAPPIRLATFASGTTFGELALLDLQARSATVVADVPLTCYVLTRERFADMQAREPAIAVRLLVNLGRELSWRMRRANQMVHQLAG